MHIRGRLDDFEQQVLAGLAMCLNITPEALLVRISNLAMHHYVGICSQHGTDPATVAQRQGLTEEEFFKVMIGRRLIALAGSCGIDPLQIDHLKEYTYRTSGWTLRGLSDYERRVFIETQNDHGLSPKHIWQGGGPIVLRTQRLLADELGIPRSALRPCEASEVVHVFLWLLGNTSEQAAEQRQSYLRARLASVRQ